MLDLIQTPREARLEAARRSLAERADGVLEAVAETNGLALAEVLSLLPPDQSRSIGSDSFDDIWQDMTEWGTVLFLIHNQHGVFEIKTTLSPGVRSNDYFNVHGAAPLGGHFRADRCAHIWLVDRPLFGRRSCSVQFFDTSGASMFKVFVGRDAARNLDAGQVARFEALWRRFA